MSYAHQSDPVIQYHITSYPILFCHIISYHILSYHIIFCPIIPYPVLSYLCDSDSHLLNRLVSPVPSCLPVPVAPPLVMVAMFLPSVISSDLGLQSNQHSAPYHFTLLRPLYSALLYSTVLYLFYAT